MRDYYIVFDPTILAVIMHTMGCNMDCWALYKSPLTVALCLIEELIIGGVKYHYLFQANTDDQYVDQCASGLASDTSDFAIC